MDKNKAIILGIRTDKPEAELYLIKNGEGTESKWQADRQLAETIHKKLQEILNKLSLSLKDIEGIVFFAGPGSFTGLRIGASVANAIAYAYKIPILARRGNKWLEQGVKDLTVGENDKTVLPFYGSPPKTTKPKK